MPDRRRFRLLFAAIVIAAGMFRVAYVLLAKDADPVVGDQVYYSAQAVTVANGHWFADPFVAGRFAADHAPMTALALAPVSWSDENPFLAQRLLMAFYGTGLVAMVGALARWLFDRRIALVATALAAVYANFWMNDALVMSETFAALTVVGVLFAAYRYDLDRRSLSAALLGGAIGLAGLARAELLLFGPLLAMPMILLDRRRRAALPARFGQLARAGLAAIVVISPWVVRNQLRFDDSVTMSTQDGLTLIGTNCPAAFEGSGIGFWHASCALAVDVPPDADQSEASAIYREQAFEYLSDNIDKLPTVVAARLGRGLSLWKTEAMGYLNQGEGRERWASTIGLWQFWVLAPLAAVGLWRWPSDQPRWPALVAVLIAILTIAALYGIPRFRIPGEVVVVLGAAVALDALGSAGFRRLRT